MERSSKKYDKESMKIALLKHEETFKQQVHELHRLYRVQKLLMSDMKKRQTNLNRFDAKKKTGSQQPCHSHLGLRRPRRTLDLELSAEEYIGNGNEHVMLEIEQESEIELTLATGSSQRKTEDSYCASDSGASFSSSSTGSVGQRSVGNEWGSFQVPDIQMRVQSERKSSHNVEELKRKDRIEQPPWFYPCLSLKMT